MSSKNASREGKNKGESPSDVHSANSWETADLGNKERNEKFLRLMGASKKEHHGKIIIGDQKSAHKRQRNEEKHLAEELEEQYEHSMDHCLRGGKRGHLGLGFQSDTDDKKELDKPEFVEEVGVEAKEEESDKDSVPDQAGSDYSEDTNDEESSSSVDKESSTLNEGKHKRKSFDERPESDTTKKMKFVKSNN